MTFNQLFSALTGALLTTTVFAAGEPEFIAALDRKAYDEAESILLANQDSFDPNFPVTQGVHAGATASFLAAAHYRWDLVTQLVERYPHLDVNAGPTMPIVGLNSATLFGLAISWRKWALAQFILEHHPEVDVNVAIYDTAAIWMAGNQREFDFLRLLLQRPDVDLNVAPPKGIFQGDTMLGGMAFHKDWDIVRLVLLTRRPAELRLAFGKGNRAYIFICQTAPGELLKEWIVNEMAQDNLAQLNELMQEDRRMADMTFCHTRHTERGVGFVNHVSATLSKAILAFGTFENQTLAVPTWMDLLPQELRADIAVRMVKVLDPDLAAISPGILLQAFTNFFVLNRPTLCFEPYANVVACRILQATGSVGTRIREYPLGLMDKYFLKWCRTMIPEELEKARGQNRLPTILTLEDRNQLVTLLSCGSTDDLRSVYARIKEIEINEGPVSMDIGDS